MLSYHANNITAGMGGVTHGEIMEYCEEKCGPDSCDDIQYQDLPDDSHCDRTSSHGYIDVGDEMMNNILLSLTSLYPEFIPDIEIIHHRTL